MTLSLETIRETAARSDSPDGVCDLFYKLIFADQLLYLAVSGNTPVFSPMETDPDHVYLRFFTHKELADRFVARRSNTTFIAITAIECAKLVRAALTAGVYGVVLNAGDQGVSISSTEFLDVFFNRILKEPELYDPDCAMLLNFLCEMRTGNRQKYGMTEGCGKTAIQPGADTLLTADMLLNLTTEKIVLQCSGEVREFTKKQLWDTVQMYGWPSPEAGPSIDVEQLTAWGKLPLEQFRIAPNPPAQQPEVVKFNTSNQEDSLKGEETQPEDCGNSQQETRLKVENARSKVQAALKAAGSKIRDAAGRVCGAVRATCKKLQENRGSDAEAVDTSGRKPAVLIGLAAAGLALIVVVVLVVQSGIRQHALSEFKGQIDDRDYAAAYDIYEEKHLGVAAENYMTDNLNKLVLQYAANEITAEELMASLRSYSNFTAIEQDLRTAQMMAAKLETSKNAYVEGRNTPDVYKRLDVWRQIIDLDAVNYAAARQDVEEHMEEYIPALGDRIEYYSTKSQAFALARYEVLAYWYPESAVTREWGKTYESMRKAPLAYYPIEVTSLTMHQSPSGYWNLTINWDNVSAKQIAEVCFTFVAYDMNGDPVTCNDGNGKWTFFDGRDVGPYKPGGGPTSDQHGWDKAFFGSAISTIKITAIKVYYSTSQTPEIYTEDIDLRSMYSKN